MRRGEALFWAITLMAVLGMVVADCEKSKTVTGPTVLMRDTVWVHDTIVVDTCRHHKRRH